jgi:diguanylate cyclase (GGDEF)-like protein
MDYGKVELSEIHWMMDTFQSIDVGLIVVDRDYRVTVWNAFMANHSGCGPERVVGKNLFEVFPEIPHDWFARKAESVRLLKSRSFTTWEQRPYLLKFKNYRPITGTAEFMYQNVTFIPLAAASGEVDQVGVVIYDVTDVAVSKQDLERVNHELERLSRTDRLTQLNNRGYWEECLVNEFKRVQRTRQPSTLIMFDIDHFKKVNDTYGHQAGDEVIRVTSAKLREAMRTTDIAGRYGGEEFGVILVNTPADGALIFAERLRQTIEASIVRHEQTEIRYTISLGIAEIGPGLKDYKQWLECADQGLYAAKHGGRNRAVIYRPELAPTGTK